MVCLSCNFTVRRDCLTTTNLLGFALDRATHKVIKPLWDKGLRVPQNKSLGLENLHAHFENLHGGSHKDLLCKLTLNICIRRVILQRV